jgi:hypothetical protein
MDILVFSEKTESTPPASLVRPGNINWLLLVMETQHVFCEVGWILMYYLDLFHASDG